MLNCCIPPGSSQHSRAELVGETVNASTLLQTATQREHVSGVVLPDTATLCSFHVLLPTRAKYPMHAFTKSYCTQQLLAEFIAQHWTAFTSSVSHPRIFTCFTFVVT